MACCHLKAAVQILLHDGVHDKRRRCGSFHPHGLDSVCGKDLTQPLGSDFRKKSSVKAYHHRLVGFVVLNKNLGYGLSHKRNVLPCKVVADYGSPPAGTEFDHIAYLSAYLIRRPIGTGLSASELSACLSETCIMSFPFRNISEEPPPSRFKAFTRPIEAQYFPSSRSEAPQLSFPNW